MDGSFTPVNRGYRIITRQFSTTYSITQGGTTQLDFGDVRYNGVLPFSFRSIWMGAGNLCMGNSTIENNHFYVTVINPVGTAATGLSSSVVLNYLVKN